MKTLLVLTVGQSDVQLVDGAVRHELDTETCGALHDEISKRSWCLTDSPSSKSKERRKLLPPNELTLCTPKLDAVLRYFEDVLPVGAIIFETRRTSEVDPRYAGTVLERRLGDRGIPHVHRRAFLEGRERLEDATSDVDGVVRRTVVDGLSCAIAEEIESLRPEHIVLATTGGLAAANDVIQELVRLHAVGRCGVTLLKVPDGALAGRDDCAFEERFQPAAGYRARWQALSLIEKGNLLGAWGAVSHLEQAPGQEWTQVVEWLARYAASLPMSDVCDIAVLSHKRMAVRAALRVELALRAGDVPRAVHGTVAFFESALWDWLRERDFAREDGVASGNIDTGFSFVPEPHGDSKKRFRKRNNTWYVDDFKDGSNAWLQVLGKPALCAFDRALSGGIRDLRNDVAHNEPTRELMNVAMKRMQDASLWSGKPDFLSLPLVQEVITELGVEEPERLCSNLLSEVRQRFLTVPGR